jgi:formate transporter
VVCARAGLVIYHTIHSLAISDCSLVSMTAAVWFPIMAFTAMGFDHSVANMFLLPLGILRGAEITVAQMFTKNLIPVTLGNIVGGALCVMMPYGTSFGNWFKTKK